MRAVPVAIAIVATALGPAGPSRATDIPPPVVVATDACPGGYREVARVGNRVVCVADIRPPGVRVTTTGCDADEFPILVDGKYGVCLR